MDAERMLRERMRSHRLTAPAAGPADAAAHLLATQAQDFGAARWALAVRSAGAPTASAVDAAFDRGELVRTWTMRGTLHVTPAADAAWLVGLTGARQEAQAAAVHRREGIDTAESGRAERLLRAALRGGGRLTRAEAYAALEAGGVSTVGQRGYHLLVLLAVRGVVCFGPVVPRPGSPTREQYVVLCEEWLTGDAPADPTAELAARYIAGHGPAGARDLAWWSGLPVTVARAALAAADGIAPDGEGPDAPHVARDRPRRSPRVPDVIALPAFDEYYLSYADRTPVCAPVDAARVGPGANGMVRPVLVHGGRVVGTWSPGGGRPRAEPFEPVDEEALARALARYAAYAA